MQNVYSEIIELYKILSQVKISLSFKIASDEKREIPNSNNINYLENIENILGLLEESPPYFLSSNDSLEKIKDWKSRINQYVRPTSEVSISLIIDNQKYIESIFNELKKFINTATSQSNFDSLSNDYTNFINQLRTFKIFSDTQIFSNKTNLEIGFISNELNQTRESYKSVNKIYEDIKNKNEKFNYFIDSENNEALKNLYDGIYKIEYQLADTYRKYSTIILIAVGLLVLLLILGGIIQNLFYLTDPKSYLPIKYDLGSFIRYLAIFTLTAPAWYFARESSKHRQVAYKAKILGTELNAFPHYVKELEKTERIKMRTDLADKFFGQELYSDKNSTPSSVLEQSKVTVDALKTVTSLVTKS